MKLEVFDEYKNKIDRLIRANFRCEDILSWLICQCIFDKCLFCDDDLYYALRNYVREVID